MGNSSEFRLPWYICLHKDNISEMVSTSYKHGQYRYGHIFHNKLNTPDRICYYSYYFITFSGESAVGKSSLVLRFVKGQFHEYQETTIGAAFLTQTVTVDGVTVKFEIWDTAGIWWCSLSNSPADDLSGQMT